MFNSLSGRVTEKAPGLLRLQTGGVEWEIVMPDSSLAELPAAGSDTRVFVHLYHRDDQMRLFGFATPAERTLFLELMKVDGVGPRQAIRILSGGSVEQLVARLDEGDIDALAQFPGIGKKTAQKIVLALRGKLTLRSESGGRGSDEIAAALAEMGFERRQANEAVAAVMEGMEGTEGKSSESLNEEEILKRAILRLSGSGR